ncbi:Rrf2 family transcriptional regulator [Mycoplana rhizolycopersici]|uniref:Rrf2 family transcriptional regulator n=1 Tax=Mycoplana rhizolycopersici TaxID=2746702 RepID=A0ABX2QA37_9HYPH|nr:Rrf2 family transcriptional regulator [Rhizobium rhizolycopersici]NVP54578.1 Rrf2 family transcriptional regulator [Rhizobium rhizolycopersici]
MKRNSRLSAALHALLHMAERDTPMTSDDIAACLNTNAVVVRRTMAGLREAGLVESGRGHGGGWVVTRPLCEISLLDVHLALGEPDLLQIGHATENPGCVVEQVVNSALDETMKEAEDILLRRFGEIKLEDMAAAFRARSAGHAATAHRTG